MHLFSLAAGRLFEAKRLLRWHCSSPTDSLWWTSSVARSTCAFLFACVVVVLTAARAQNAKELVDVCVERIKGRGDNHLTLVAGQTKGATFALLRCFSADTDSYCFADGTPIDSIVARFVKEFQPYAYPAATVVSVDVNNSIDGNVRAVSRMHLYFPCAISDDSRMGVADYGRAAGVCATRCRACCDQRQHRV